MQKVIDLINKEFKERKSLGGNWEAYEVEEYLEEIQTSLIIKIKAINFIPCCKSDSELLCEHSMVVNRETMNSMICSKGCGYEIK